MENRIKVLFVAPHLDGGGSERVLLNLINSIDRNLIVPELLVFKKEGSLADQLSGDINVVKNRVCRPRFAVFELSKLIKENQYDAVFTFKQYIALVVFAAVKLSGVRLPIIYREITHVSAELGRNFTGLNIHRLYNNSCVYRFLYKHMSAIIAPSQEIKKDLRTRFSVHEEKITVIHNPVNVRFIEDSCKEEVSHPWFHENIPLLISAGRLVKQKNFELLINAFKRLIAMGYTARLVIIGKGEDRDKLTNMIKKLGLEEIAVILEHQPNPFKYISKADIFILSSLWEGFPNILLEAMICGTAVISTDCPSGPAEIITNNVDGLLIESGNTEQLACAVAGLLEDNGRLMSLGKVGREKVLGSYTTEKIIPLYMKLFFNCIQQGG